MNLTLQQVHDWAAARRQHSQVGVASNPYFCPLAECAKELLGASGLEVCVWGEGIEWNCQPVQTDFSVTTFYHLIDFNHTGVEPVLREEVLRVCELMEKYRGED